MLGPHSPYTVRTCLLYEQKASYRRKRLLRIMVAINDILRIIVIILSTATWVTAILISGFGLWLTTNERVSYLESITMLKINTFLPASVIMIIAGFSTMIVPCIGCSSAQWIRPTRLMIFIGLMTTIITLETTSIGIILSLKNQAELDNWSVSNLQRNLEHYFSNSSNIQFKAWSWIQAANKCCGPKGVTSYLSVNGYGAYDELEMELEKLTKDDPLPYMVTEIVPISCCTVEKFSHKEAYIAYKRKPDSLLSYNDCQLKALKIIKTLKKNEMPINGKVNEALEKYEKKGEVKTPLYENECSQYIRNWYKSSTDTVIHVLIVCISIQGAALLSATALSLNLMFLNGDRETEDESTDKLKRILTSKWRRYRGKDKNEEQMEKSQATTITLTEPIEL